MVSVFEIVFTYHKNLVKIVLIFNASDETSLHETTSTICKHTAVYSWPFVAQQISIHHFNHCMILIQMV